MNVLHLRTILHDMQNNAWNDDCSVYGNDGNCNIFSVNRILFDDDGDLCLQSDDNDLQILSAKTIETAIRELDEETRVFFVISNEQSKTYYKLSDDWSFDHEYDAVIELEDINY